MEQVHCCLASGLKICIWGWMDFFGCRDEERWGVPRRQGVFYKVGRLNRRKGGEKKMLSIDCFLCQRGIVGLPADIWMSPEWSRLPSQSQRRNMIGWEMPNTGMAAGQNNQRLSCRLLPYRCQISLKSIFNLLFIKKVHIERQIKFMDEFNLWSFDDLFFTLWSHVIHLKALVWEGTSTTVVAKINFCTVHFWQTGIMLKFWIDCLKTVWVYIYIFLW